MKYVQANTLMYDASVGRVEPGETYYVEDDKAERWVVAGVAAVTTAPRPPEPPAAILPPEEEAEDEDAPETSAELRAEVRRRFESGESQRAVAEQLGISRARVQTLLRN